MAVTTLAPWFGSNRMNAEAPGEELRGCEWVGIPFAGGMSEVPHIDARTLVINDIHRDIINLAQVAAIPAAREWLMREAAAAPFHPDVLKSAQDRCKATPPPTKDADCRRALDYFIAVWMGRSAAAGTDKEFNGNLALRWNAGGGDSNVRYRSAIESLEVFGKAMERATFSTLECADFLNKCHDKPKHGLYIDSPWPDDGDSYRHKFGESALRGLAHDLAQFREIRVVVRYGEHPLIRELYPTERWTWRSITSRTQANKDKAEFLIINGPSYASESGT